jgi:hypothetical protein
MQRAVRRALALVASSCVLACVQTGSVGSDTGRSDDTIAATADGESADDDSTGTGDDPDPYEVCEHIDTTGEPFPDSCAPSQSDSPCLQCIKLVCCSELLSCPSYQACACHIDCAAANSPPDVCASACGANDGCDLSGCGELECEQLCVG